MQLRQPKFWDMLQTDNLNYRVFKLIIQPIVSDMFGEKLRIEPTSFVDNINSNEEQFVYHIVLYSVVLFRLIKLELKWVLPVNTTKERIRVFWCWTVTLLLICVVKTLQKIHILYMDRRKFSTHKIIIVFWKWNAKGGRRRHRRRWWWWWR